LRIFEKPSKDRIQFKKTRRIIFLPGGFHQKKALIYLVFQSTATRSRRKALRERCFNENLASSEVRPTQSFTHATIVANSQAIVIVLWKILKGHKLFGMGLMGIAFSFLGAQSLSLTPQSKGAVSLT
jgi:hypothetical protein